MNSRAPAPQHDWLEEFAHETSAPVNGPLPARDPAPIRAARRRPRLRLVFFAAGVVLVSLVEVPRVRHGPWLLVPWDDLAAPAAVAEAVGPGERTAPPEDRARQQRRPALPARLPPRPPSRRDVSIPIVAASSRRVKASAVTPPVMSVGSFASLDGLLGRAVTSAALAAPPVAPARPPAATPAEAPSEEAARRASRTAAVESVVDRYRRAYNNRDARAVEAFWPGVNVRALERAFGRLEVQRFVFDRCRVDLAGTRAFADCSGSARTVKKGGDRNPPAQARQWTFTLRQANEGWVILNVNSRPLQ